MGGRGGGERSYTSQPRWSFGVRDLRGRRVHGGPVAEAPASPAASPEASPKAGSGWRILPTSPLTVLSSGLVSLPIRSRLTRRTSAFDRLLPARVPTEATNRVRGQYSNGKGGETTASDRDRGQCLNGQGAETAASLVPIRSPPTAGQLRLESGPATRDQCALLAWRCTVSRSWSSLLLSGLLHPCVAISYWPWFLRLPSLPWSQASSWWAHLPLAPPLGGCMNLPSLSRRRM